MIKKKKIETANAPAAIGPYSQGINCGATIYVSGQLPIDPSTGELISDDITAQTHQSLKNLKAVLDADGLQLSDVVKTTVYLDNMSDFAAMNDVYAEYFEDPFPARAAFEVAALPKAAKVEIEAIAINRLADLFG